MSQERATVDEYNDLLAEVERLRAIIGDQQILLDEHGMDNRHSYEEGGSSERAAVVAWLRDEADTTMRTGFARQTLALMDAADRIENGEHRREGDKP